LGHADPERVAPGDGLALAAGPRAELRVARACREVGVGIGVVREGHGADHARLAILGTEVEADRCAGSQGQSPSLRAAAVRVEGEAAALPGDALAEHHAYLGAP